MSKDLQVALLMSVLSFLSLCISFSPSIVSAYLKSKHTAVIFGVNMALFILSSIVTFAVINFIN